MDPVSKLEEIAGRMEPPVPERPVSAPGTYRTIKIKGENYDELLEWKELLGKKSLSDTISALQVMARRELKNVVKREAEIRKSMSHRDENLC